jgi:hypothetical protein
MSQNINPLIDFPLNSTINMKTKKTFAAVLALALVANLTIAGMAMADDATATLDLAAGSLELSLDSSTLDFGTQSVDIVDQAYTADFPRVEFGDMRSTTSGFTLTASTTVMSDGTHTDIAYTNLGIRADASDTITPIDTSDTTGVSIESSASGQFSAFGGTGTASDALTIVTGDARERVALYEINPVIEMVVPASQPAGTYTGTLTIAIQ